MKELKHKIISLDKDKIHLIAISSENFTQENFDSLSKACNAIGLRSLLIAVKDPNDFSVAEIGKIELKMADGKLMEINKIG